MSEPGYVIRQATEADLDEVMALTRELAQFEEMADELAATPAQFRRALFGPDPVATVSLQQTDQGEVAGHALWFRTFSTFLGEPGIWLEDLYVRPAFRGRGWGRALLEHLRSSTAGRVEWDVLEWNEKAIGFYGRLGASVHKGWTRYRWSPE